jgi:hypothetical protein
MRTRRGLLALGLAPALAAALSAATPFAAAAPRVETKARRTVTCTTAQGALQIWAFATNPTIGSANVTISTGNPNQPDTLLGVSSQLTHYGLTAGRCHSVTKRVALTRRGLTSAGVVHAGDVRSPAVYCAATRRVLIRLLLTYNDSQKPVAATIEILTPKGKRIGYVQWSPQRSVTYYSSACTSRY